MQSVELQLLLYSTLPIESVRGGKHINHQLCLPVLNIILALSLSVPGVSITHGTPGCLITHGKLIEQA